MKPIKPHCDLTVVTHTRMRNPYPELLDRCKQSVADALPPNSQHLVIVDDSEVIEPTRTNAQRAEYFANMRYSAIQYSKYFAFVDDDDYIHPDSLKHCMNALTNSEVGVAVTNEVVVDVTGKELSAYRLPRHYCGVVMHPRTIHHLTVLNRDFVSPIALNLALQFGVGVEWTMKASACLVGGGIHIPIDGYYWTQHKSRSTENTLERRSHNGNIHKLGNAIKAAFPTRIGRIPTV